MQLNESLDHYVKADFKYGRNPLMTEFGPILKCGLKKAVKEGNERSSGM